MIDLEFLKAVATERGVSELELETLSLAIEGKSTKAIAEQLEVRDDTVRKRLSDVYRKFQVPGIGPVKLANLQRMLMALSEERQAQSAANMLSHETAKEKKEPDWGDAPEVTSFFGRQKELAQLEKWIIKDKCKLVAILGMSGIGKTALSVKLAEKLQDKFDRVIWRSLRYNPDIDKLLTELIAYISSEAIPEDINDKISLLINCLSESRCLLILDNLETILQDKELAGLYLEKYQDYGLLLERVGKERRDKNNSCLAIVSREEPKEISQLTIQGFLVRSLQLEGLEKDAREILQAEGLSKEQDNEWTKLIDLYKGNPLFIKIVCRSIKELLNGDVSKLFKYSFSAYSMEIKIFIGEQFNRLDPLEQQIIYWLAVGPHAVSLDKLDELNQLLDLSESDLFNALQSLIRRSFIEKEGDKYTLQFVVKEYTFEQLAEEFYKEIEQLTSLDNVKFISNYPIPNSSDTDRLNEDKNRLIKYFKKKLERDKNRSQIENNLEAIVKMPGVESKGHVKTNVETLLKAIK